MFRKKSFIEKLTGGVRINDHDDYESEIEQEENEETKEHTEGPKAITTEEGEGQLTVDVYQTPTDIIIKTMVAGVRPDDLDVSITRDMVTIRGRREEEKSIDGEDYYHKELYWGSFSRTILLPQEVDIEEAEATEKHGLLILKLPKLDKDRQAQLKVKNG